MQLNEIVNKENLAMAELENEVAIREMSATTGIPESELLKKVEELRTLKTPWSGKKRSVGGRMY